MDRALVPDDVPERYVSARGRQVSVEPVLGLPVVENLDRDGARRKERGKGEPCTGENLVRTLLLC